MAGGPNPVPRHACSLAGAGPIYGQGWMRFVPPAECLGEPSLFLPRQCSGFPDVIGSRSTSAARLVKAGLLETLPQATTIVSATWMVSTMAVSFSGPAGSMRSRRLPSSGVFCRETGTPHDQRQRAGLLVIIGSELVQEAADLVGSPVMGNVHAGRVHRTNSAGKSRAVTNSHERRQGPVRPDRQSLHPTLPTQRGG